MTEVVAHVVAAEREHGHRVAPELTHFPGDRGRSFATDRCTQKSTVLPVESFGYEWNDAGAPSTKQDRIDRNTLGILPLRRNHWALACRNGESRVGVRRYPPGFRCPDPPKPVHQFCWLLVGHAFPPDVAIHRHGAIGEDGIFGNAE